MYDKNQLEGALKLLGDFLEQDGFSAALIVCGGAALSITGKVFRTTKDVDVLALIDEEKVINARPLPTPILKASHQVALALGLHSNWLNEGPADQIRFGFPHGMQDRLQQQRFGKALTVFFIGRLDQIHLKLFAAVDQGQGKHVDDLRALVPTEEEIRTAALWVAGQDASVEFGYMLRQMLVWFGYERVAAEL